MNPRNKAGQEFVAWVNRSMIDECVFFELWHYNADKQPIAKVDYCKVGNVDADGVADRFFGVAHEYSKELEGSQLFQVRGYIAQNEHEPRAYHHFRCDGKIYGGLTPSEEPSAKGLTSQGMRHIEAREQSQYKMGVLLFDKMGNMIDRLGTMVENLSAANTAKDEALIKAGLMLADGKHAHQVEILKLQHAQENNKMLIGVAGPMLNAATGVEVMPQASADSMMIDALANSLSTQEFEAIGAFLAAKDPRLAAMFKARLAQGLENKRKERQTQIDSIPKSPEEDAAGGKVLRLNPKTTEGGNS